MKIAIHDYVGHPFQVHLSRNLAQRGHDVFHIYCVDHPGPKAAFARADDSPALNFVGIEPRTPDRADSTDQAALC